MQVMTDRLAGTGLGCPRALRGAVVAIGNFDGVHRGHQAVIASAVRRAHAAGRPAGVLLFDPHPRQFFQPDQPFFTITPLPLRLRLLAALELDVAVVQPFDASVAALSAEEFVDEVLVRGLGVAEVVIGYDFHYGRGRSGSPDTLREAGASLGFAVTVTPAFRPASHAPAYSSSGIRQRLREGDVVGAAEQLGYAWRISGTVIGGAGRGTGLGTPHGQSRHDTGPGPAAWHLRRPRHAGGPIPGPCRRGLSRHPADV